MMDAFLQNGPIPLDLGPLISSIVPVTIVLSLCLIMARLMPRASSDSRHRVYAMGIYTSLLMPVIIGLLPQRVLPTGTIFMPMIPIQPSNHPMANRPWTWEISEIGMALWALGSALLLLRLMVGYLRASQLWKDAIQQPRSPWYPSFEYARARFALRTAPTIAFHNTIQRPLTLGLFQPKILLPLQASTWPDSQLKAVFLHEMAHILRRDTWILLATNLLSTLFWWNPLTWLIAKGSHKEREYACDDLAIEKGIRPSDYAHSLLEVTQAMHRKKMPLTTLSMSRFSPLESRLRYILNTDQPRHPMGKLKRHALLFSSMIIAVGLAAHASPGQRPESVQPQKSGTLHLEDAFIRHQSPLRYPVSTVDLNAVTQMVRQEMKSLEQCYHQELIKSPGLSGDVHVHVVISELGKSKGSCIVHDTIGDPGVLACVNDFVNALAYPIPSDGPVDVSLPFVFNPPSPKTSAFLAYPERP